jgi:hypothetical protein
MISTARTARRLPILGAVFAALALSACSYASVGPDFAQEVKGMDPATFECCADPEKYYPAPLVRIALEVGNEIGPAASAMAYGEYEESEYPGLLTGKTEAHAEILRQLAPLDIVLVSNHSYQVGRLMPGRFSHSVVYLGTEAQLRAAGLWNLPALVPYHDQIRAGNIMIEAAAPDVHLISPQKTFEVDQVLAMRPALSPADKRRALERMLAVMGKPFNFRLGIDPQGESFACTGLVVQAMPELGFTIREVYGQRVLMPDDVAAQAVRGERLTPLIYMTGTEDGYTRRGMFALMVEMAAYWGVPGKDG